MQTYYTTKEKINQPKITNKLQKFYKNVKKCKSLSTDRLFYYITNTMHYKGADTNENS